MTSVLIIFGLLGLGFFGYLKYKRDYKAGQTKERLDNAEDTLSNVKKAKDAIARLDDDKRERLRERYKNIK